MNIKYRYIAVASLTLSLSACSSLSWIPGSQLFSGKKDAPTPLKALAPLTKQTIKTTKNWEVNTASVMKENKVHPYLDNHIVYVAGGNSVSAWHKSSGKLLWKTPIGETVTAGVNGTLLTNPQNNSPIKTKAEQVFIGTSNGNAISLDAKTGKIQWIERLTSEILSVSPAHNNRVAFRTVDGKIHGLSTKSGELIWQRAQSAPALSILGTSVPIIASSLVIAGFDNGKVIAYRLEDGQTFWEVSLALPRGNTELERVVDIDGKLTALGNALFVASLNGSAAGINMETGKKAWSTPFSSQTGASASSESMFSSDDKGNIWRIDPRTGEPVWSMDDLQGRLPSVPTIVNNSTIVVTDIEGNIHWVNTPKGTFSARNKGDSAGYSVEPEVSGKSIYTIGKNGILSKFTLN